MPLAPGTRLGPYEILAPIGAGGMGEVYRARDTRLARTVAVKVLPQHLSPSPEARQRFEREAKTISQLSHPHICALYDVGSQDGIEYLVMELLDGETLADRLAKRPSAARAGPALRDRDRRRARRRPPPRHRASGPEARQRDADEVGREVGGLRAREGSPGRRIRSRASRPRRPPPETSPAKEPSSARSLTWRPSSSRERAATPGRTSSPSARRSTRWRRGGRRFRGAAAPP